MKENKIIIKYCFVTVLISFIVAVLVSALALNEDHKICTFVYDICLGLLTGALLSAITATIVYNCQKQEKICVLKSNINKEIERYLDLFYSIEYVYFEDKLSNELKSLGEYERNKSWYESFVLNNKKSLKSNIKKLKKIRTINRKKLQSNINELLKINKKMSIPKYDYFNSKIENIDNLSRYFDFNPIEANIPNVYKEIQDMIFECQNENGKKTLNDIQLKNNDIYPTKKINLIINYLESISSKLQ